MSVQGKAGLGAQCVASAETADGCVLAVEQSIPGGFSRIRIEHDLEAVFARVAGTRHERGPIGHPGLQERIARQRVEIGAAQRL